MYEPAFRALTSSTMWKELTCFLVGALKLAGELCPAVGTAPVTDLCVQLQNKLLATQHFWWEACLILAPQPTET